MIIFKSMKIFYLYLTYGILFLFLNSCAHLLEKGDDFTQDLSCIKKEGENRYSAFGIEFNKKSDVIYIMEDDSYCLEHMGVNFFIGMFKVNILDKTKDNYENGNSTFLQLTISDFKNLEKEHKTNQELKNLVQASINKRIIEMENNNDPRFSNIKNKLEELVHGKTAICQELFQSGQDSKAANLPKSEEYLVMNNLYKSCVIPGSEIFIDMTISVRGNKIDIRNFDLGYLQKQMSSIEGSLLDKRLKQNLHSIINTPAP